MTQQVETTSARQATTRRPIVHAHLERHRDGLRTMLSRPGSAGLALVRKHADVMDDLLRKLCVGARSGESGASFLLGAVGGYGRGVLGWKSDVDVCFLTRDAHEALGPIVEEILYPLWDVGLTVGHQVITISEVVEAVANDLPTATELLDFRPLSGDLSLLCALEDCLYASALAEGEVAAFIARLEERTSARHVRFGDSLYLLEPDVKNGTGGLRDLDFALWAARARFRGRDLKSLPALGVLSWPQVEEAESALDFLWTIRNHLHELSGRRADRLTFAAQEAVARELGYGARVDVAAGASALERTGAMIEAFMSDYYRQARVITRLSEQILGRAKRRASTAERDDGPRDGEQSLGDGLVRCDGGIGLEHPEQLHAQPVLALRLFATALGHDQPVASRSRDAVAQATADPEFCARLRESREACGLFVQLVGSHRKAPFRAGSIVAELHDVGLVLALIPEFAPVVGRVHHDIYHVYTVDVHSVAAVDRLHALARGEHASEHPLGCRLAAEITRPKLLALATLLHDVGKAIGGHNHAQRGAEMGRTILTRLGLEPEEIDDACHLILKHLVLYVVAVRRDLSDPATIEEFVREVRGREGLRDLYLLTIADLSTTSPNAMTRWKSGMLDALWRAADALLSGVAGPAPSRASRVRADVRKLWPDDADAAALDCYLDTMPERYLLSNTPAEIMAHALIATQPRAEPVATALLPSKLEEVMELCVITEGRANTGLCIVAGDRPGLLAAISAAISANRLHIQAAQIYSRPLDGGSVQAVDLFWVRIPPEDDLDERMTKLQRDLNAIITGQIAPRALLKPARTSRYSSPALPPVRSQVVIDHQASSRHTIIEVLTQDRPALLFHLAEALHTLGLTIQVAKISTEGTRVIDVFYVSDADGGKVAAGPRSREVHEFLLATLAVDDSDALSHSLA